MKALRDLRALEAKWETVRNIRQNNCNMRKNQERKLAVSLHTEQRLSAIATEEKLANIASAQLATQDYIMRALLWRSSEHQKQEDEELLESAIALFEEDLVRKFEEDKYVDPLGNVILTTRQRGRQNGICALRQDEESITEHQGS